MDTLKTIWSSIVAAIVAAVLIGLGLLAWEKATDGGLISALKGATKADVKALQTDHLERLSKTDANLARLRRHFDKLDDRALTRCRVCFQETEGSSQCQRDRSDCSGWAGVGRSADWTNPFRDDTDNRRGGCTYQWRLECR